MKWDWWSFWEEAVEEIFYSVFYFGEEALLLALFSALVWVCEVVVLDCFQAVFFYYLEYLPLLHFEAFTAGACEISFVEFVHVWVLEIAGEVACCVWNLVWLVTYQEIVTSSEGWAITFEAANCFVFERFY